MLESILLSEGQFALSRLSINRDIWEIFFEQIEYQPQHLDHTQISTEIQGRRILADNEGIMKCCVLIIMVSNPILYPTHPPAHVLIAFFLLYMEERQEIIQIVSDYICPRKRWFLMSGFRRTRHSAAVTKVLLRYLSDDARIRIQIVPSPTTLHVQATRSSSKVAKHLLAALKAQCHFALGIQFCLRARKTSTTWEWHHGGGGKPRITESFLDGGTIEWIEGGKMSDKGLGMIKNGIPVWTFKLDFRVDIMLGEGIGVVGTKGEIAAEESVGDDGRAQREQ